MKRVYPIWGLGFQFDLVIFTTLPTWRAGDGGPLPCCAVLSSGETQLKISLLSNAWLYLSLIFHPSLAVQASFGGNLRFVLTASAPISPTVLSFLRAVLGCYIFEGYGQTECTAGCTFSMPGDWSAGEQTVSFFTLLSFVVTLVHPVLNGCACSS